MSDPREPFSFPHAEERVLRFWNEHRVFEKSLAQRAKRKKFVFYEGPPTANGRPGIHHVLARAFKDVVLRYKTMQGFYVPRKGGWDTHGLPVELEVEKQLGFTSKKDIEKFGIAEFNRKCKESVWKYKDEWERLTERMGYWLDLKNPYVTYENDYVETLWWIIKEVWKKKLLYKGHRVAPWCPRCGTALSSHEMAQGYKEVTDQSIFVRFRLKKGQKIGKFTTDDKTYILSWTTTPWTLPGNVALAVGKHIQYVRVSPDDAKETLILAKDIFAAHSEKFAGYRAMGDVKGSELVELVYEPLFNIKSLQNKKSHRVYAADFVTTTDGTGVVHTAVMYGEDDYRLGTEIGLPQHHTVDEQGRFTKEVPGLAGMKAKSKDAVETATTEQKIFDHLAKRNLLFKTEKYTHEYPHCWRCQTPLLYYARTSWFVAMSKLRAKLLASNKTINWVPAHMKEGRFGEWLREVKDWNFSRERYWGTPLPIWECKKCDSYETIGSLAELKARSIARNTFLFMRHGEADNVTLNTATSRDTKEFTPRLTAKGKREVEATARALSKKRIDIIVSSPLARTKATAMIVKKYTRAALKYDKGLIDINAGMYEGRPLSDIPVDMRGNARDFDGALTDGESLNDAGKRMVNVVRKLDAQYKGKTILVVSHGDPLWRLKGIFHGFSRAEQLQAAYPKTGVLYSIIFGALPFDEEGNVDMHRPYIDEIEVKCAQCGAAARRIKELADVWFDSGAMPFASQATRDARHEIRISGITYPADYIAEAVDQTRGWFYTLLAVSTLLGEEAPYKNVISLGHILDKHGAKMSKSKGNVVDPWAMVEKYGMDAVRWHFYTAAPIGEPMNFDELELQKTTRRFHLILWNSFMFWRTYAKRVSSIKYQDSRNALDQWILARLQETTVEVTTHMDKYAIRDAALAIEGFVDDLSRWYIRRSRRRFQKPESAKDFQDASATLGYVLSETAKLIAPFNPFFAEALYSELNVRGSRLGVRHSTSHVQRYESVHLEDWPAQERSRPSDFELLSAMAEVRSIASDALAKRAALGIKIRQPLAKLVLKVHRNLSKDFLDILADEINVKKIEFNSGIQDAIEFDTTINEALREEGLVREFGRMAAELRAKANLKLGDSIVLMMEVSEMLHAALQKNEKLLKKEVGAKSVEYKKSAKFNAEMQVQFDGSDIWLAVRKVK